MIRKAENGCDEKIGMAFQLIRVRKYHTKKTESNEQLRLTPSLNRIRFEYLLLSVQ